MGSHTQLADHAVQGFVLLVIVLQREDGDEDWENILERNGLTVFQDHTTETAGSLLWLSKPHRTEGTSALVPDSILVPQGPKQRLEWGQKRHVSRSGLALLELCTVEYGIWGNVHC